MLARLLACRHRVRERRKGSGAAAAAAQQRGDRSAPVRSSDKVEDAFRLARAYRLVGDVQRDRGDLRRRVPRGAADLRCIPTGVAETPDEMQDHATLLQRLGRNGEAQPLTDKLRAMGYRVAM